MLSLVIETTGHSQHLAVQTAPQLDRSASPCLSMGSQKSHLSVPEAKDRCAMTRLMMTIDVLDVLHSQQDKLLTHK